ncbi:hypothetical protein GCM10025885_25630 [Tetragenococcus osmophilus]|uniref:Uncharacterized protein n=1 Tax=Tetragenococcus osmophilus TaxID=526944 RepID=A0AA37XNP4_9ENTE|nr:hypothetical protein GCM10025885_25630 [Tetragenococcus osmophilus]
MLHIGPPFRESINYRKNVNYLSDPENMSLVPLCETSIINIITFINKETIINYLIIDI